VGFKILIIIITYISLSTLADWKELLLKSRGRGGEKLL